MIKALSNAEEKKTVARQILEALPECFGIPESTENYISQSAEQVWNPCQIYVMTI